MPARPTLSPNLLCALLAAWIVLTGHQSFWRLFFDVQGTGAAAWPFALSLAAALFGLNLLLLRALSPGFLRRVVLTVLLVVAAGAGWFMDTYGVALDSDMIRNALQTNPTEARDVLGWGFLWRLLWQAGPAIALVWWVRVPPQRWWPATRAWLLGVVGGLALVLAAGLPFYGSYLAYFRNENAARYLITPANVVAGVSKITRQALRAPQPHEVVGADARRAAAAQPRPLLVLVVVGETARAANFSLGGYARDTNPGLARRDVFYFSDVTACGTSTAVSLPCMFSDLPREEFRLARAAYRDSVLDILQRAGLAVEWIENQSGCKKTCARVPTTLAETFHPAACADGECRDETLLHALDARLPAVTGDAVLVMHAMGSHGPAYYRRVPPAFARFQPSCNTRRIDTCTDAEIVNAYDNTILYTDHILSGLIDRLAAAADRVDAVLLYVSDHGESLGEGGLYLHGQPWVIAPDVQKQVPMLLWLSSNAPARLGLAPECLRERLGAPLSHDHLAHTLLGVTDVKTTIYRESLDLTRGCRQAN